MMRKTLGELPVPNRTVRVDRVEIGCTSNWRKIIGWVPLDRKRLSPGSIVEFELFDNHTYEYTKQPQTVRLEVGEYLYNGRSFFALKSGNHAIATLRQIPEFKENKS